MKKYLLFESSEDATKYVSEGQKRLVKAGGKSICLTRFNGELIAVDNACPHRGHPLSEGSINHYGEIVCASHAYRFHLHTGQESENRCEPLSRYKVSQEGAQLFIEV
jgi:3-phenylpropionate/trans-cinnamate dioxygenase ferredoxin subunit